MTRKTRLFKRFSAAYLFGKRRLETLLAFIDILRTAKRPSAVPVYKFNIQHYTAKRLFQTQFHYNKD